MHFHAPPTNESTRIESRSSHSINTSSSTNNAGDRQEQGPNSGVAPTTRTAPIDVMDEILHTSEQTNQDQDYDPNDYSVRHQQHQNKEEGDQETTANKERRSSIQFILKDSKLTNEERRHSIQILMDPRRRSSFGLTFAEAAKNVAAGFAFRRNSSSSSSSSNSSSSGSINSNSKSSSNNSYSSFEKDISHYDDDWKPMGREIQPSTITADRNTTNAVIATSSNNITNDQHQKVSSPQGENENIIAYSVTGKPIGDAKKLEYNRPPCSHYKRHCSIISPCCGMVFGCRLCHDDCEEQEIPFMRQMELAWVLVEQNEDEEDQEVSKQRKKLKEVVKEKNNENSDGEKGPEEIVWNATDVATTETRHGLHQETDHCCKRIETTSTTDMCNACPITNETDCKISSVASSPLSDEMKSQKKRKKSTSAKKYSRRLSLSSLTTNGGDDLHHKINRTDIKEIICRNCFTRQSSNTNTCINCNIIFGEYHCNLCNLWMEKKDKPYHCHKCGICRVGGKDNYKHCDSCGMCIEKSFFSTHNCTAGKLMSNCPVCFEDLFSSRTACHELPCDHSIHVECYRELSSMDIRCPICKKTMIQEEYRQQVWRGLKEDIEAQPVPPDQTRVVDVICNDCELNECDRRWHPLGVDCSRCSSFNTSIDFQMVGHEAFDYLLAIEETRRRMDKLGMTELLMEE